MLRTLLLASLSICSGGPAAVHAIQPPGTQSDPSPPADLVVDFTPGAGCEAPGEIRPARDGAALTACSLEGALGHLTSKGDPTPGDGRAVVHVRGRGTAEATVPVLPVALVLVGEGDAALVAVAPGRPVLVLRGVEQPVHVTGLRLERGGLLAQGCSGALRLRRLAVQSEGAGVDLRENSGEIAIDDLSVETAGSPAFVAADNRSIVMRGHNTLRAYGAAALDARDGTIEAELERVEARRGEHGVRLERLKGRIRFRPAEGQTGVFVEETTTDAVRLVEVEDVELYMPRVRSSGGHGISLLAGASATTRLLVEGAVLEDNAQAGVFANAAGSARLTLLTRGSRFLRNNAAIVIAAGESAKVEVDLSDNSEIKAHQATAIAVTQLSTASPEGLVVARIVGNQIGAAGDQSASSGSALGAGIEITSSGAGRMFAEVSGNTVRGVATGHGIAAYAREGSSRLDLVLERNRVEQPIATESLHGLLVQAGAASSDRGTLCARVGGNEVSSRPDRAPIRVRQRFETRLLIEPFAGADSAEALAPALAETNRASAAIEVQGTAAGVAACERRP